MTATMPRPGASVIVRQSPPPRVIPTDSGVWFAVGLTDKGPANRAVLISSLNDFVNWFGQRQTYSPLYDAVETYFRLGGSQAYVGRVVGPAAVIASWNIADSGAAVSLVAKAKGPGAYANTRRITVQVPGNGGTLSSFSLLITDTADATISEQSPDFTTQAGAVAWSQYSSNIDITLGASANMPAAAAATGPGTAGTDDRTNVTDVQWRSALNLFSRDLGPGQVSQVGRSSNQAYVDTLAHAAAMGHRTAILDGPDSSSATSGTTLVSALRGTNDEWGAMFQPWVVIPGLTPNTTRIAPPSAAVAARCAWVTGSGESPNQPAAGMPEGILDDFVIGLSQPAYDNNSGIQQTRDTMYSGGVNQIALRYGSYVVFGWRTLVDPSGLKQDWLDLGNRRLACAMTAEALAISENYILKEIDGQGRLFARFQGDLQGMCARYYDLGSLYGDKPEDAYIVDVGPSVNTPATIQNKELHALIACRMSQDAELVVIEINKTPVSQSLSAV